MLRDGMRLCQEEFRALYEKSRLKKVELVEGIVRMPSRVNSVYHAEPHCLLFKFLGYYEEEHANVKMGISPTVKLDAQNEVQPDIIMFKEDGTCRVEPSGYLCGPPELVCEISDSSYHFDSHEKKKLYEKSGVKEYIIFHTGSSAEIKWFVLREDEYHAIEAENGLMKSQTFQGLVLNLEALLEKHLERVNSFLLNVVNAAGH